MTLLIIAVAATVTYMAFHTRVQYWRYIVAGTPLVAVTILGMGFIMQAGAPNPLVVAGFLMALLALKALALARAQQLTRRERARAAYRFATANCPTCDGKKERAMPVCAQCEWTLAAARAGTIVVKSAPAQEAA